MSTMRYCWFAKDSVMSVQWSTFDTFEECWNEAAREMRDQSAMGPKVTLLSESADECYKSQESPLSSHCRAWSVGTWSDAKGLHICRILGVYL